MNDYATYSPEDNKLRLYVGRVPRDEYEKLRAEGWTSTPKQGCDFVAVWTPERLQTALDYADGELLDEDQGPAERAADRAERFAGYREKRTAEACGHADTYEAGPQVHGFQSQARAERAAGKLDRFARYAGDAWSKAEYWQQRTAGVIAHALHASAPGVRMGRIKTIETELRGVLSRWKCSREEIKDARALLWINHLELRLAYENQMLEAQGGRAAHIEMEPGGFIGNYQIHRVNKSPATGRVVSVAVRVPKVTGYVYRSRNVAGTDYALSQIDTERLPVNAYRAPTDEDRAEFAALLKAKKDAAPDRDPCPLINPTDEEAERLQALWNERAADTKRADVQPQQIVRITQARYSACSKGAYATVSTRGLCQNAELEPRVSNMYHAGEKEAAKLRGPALCKVRQTSGAGDSYYNARRLIIIIDKPRQKFPAGVWTMPAPEPVAVAVTAPLAQAHFGF